MAEIPEHLLKRSAERRKALGLPTGEEGDAEPVAAAGGGGAGDVTPPTPPTGGTPAGGEPAGEEPAGESKGGVPAHLLARSRARKAALSGGGGEAGGGGDVPAAAAGGGGRAATATATAPLPTSTGPGGHTQRLLTVVKSGSIQQTRAEAQDKVHTWPHLLAAEFAALLVVTAGLLVFSALVRAPLLGLADFNKTPNPSKAPWYFLGLHELLTMFHPMVAGVTVPGMGLFLMMVAPFVDKNPSQKPKDRKFAISIFTLFLMLWAVLVIIGSFFRGPGFNFTFPWNDGVFFEL